MSGYQTSKGDIDGISELISLVVFESRKSKKLFSLSKIELYLEAEGVVLDNQQRV